MPRRLTRSTTLVVVAGCVVAALLVALALTWRAWQHERNLRVAGDDAQAAARRAAVSLTTYDYRSLGHAYDWAQRDGTPHFRKQFASVSASARASVLALKVVAKGAVVASAPDVRDSDHVTVLLFVDQQVRSESATGTVTEQPRISMSMIHTEGRWLVDSVSLENSSG